MLMGEFMGLTMNRFQMHLRLLRAKLLDVLQAVLWIYHSPFVIFIAAAAVMVSSVEKFGF